MVLKREFWICKRTKQRNWKLRSSAPDCRPHAMNYFARHLSNNVPMKLVSDINCSHWQCPGRHGGLGTMKASSWNETLFGLRQIKLHRRFQDLAVIVAIIFYMRNTFWPLDTVITLLPCHIFFWYLTTKRYGIRTFSWSSSARSSQISVLISCTFFSWKLIAKD